MGLEGKVAFGYTEKREKRLSQGGEKHLEHLVLGLDWNTEPVESVVENEPGVMHRWIQ